MSHLRLVRKTEPRNGIEPSHRSPIGERLRALRQQRGLTLERAAARAGITSNTLRQIETAAQPNPRLHTLLSLMHGYDLHSLDALLDTPSIAKGEGPAGTSVTPAAGDSQGVPKSTRGVRT